MNKFQPFQPYLGHALYKVACCSLDHHNCTGLQFEGRRDGCFAMCCIARSVQHGCIGKGAHAAVSVSGMVELACRLSIGSSRCEAQPETAVSWPQAQRALPPELLTAGAGEDLLTLN